MAYSSSDFVEDVLNHLYDNGLLSPRIMDAGDLGTQKTAVIEALNKLLMGAPAPAVPAAAVTTAAGDATKDTPSVRFMEELLAENESLTGISIAFGAHTLADCMYLLSAMQKGAFIEVHHPSESHIVAVLEGLPSWEEWLTYVREVGG